MELNLLRNFAVALLVFVILDGIWLGFIIKPTYSRLLNRFKLKKINLLSALFAYALLAIGISFFVVPIVSSLANAFLYGALFGLIIYGVYDFTNFAIFENYEPSFVIIDILWGSIASGITTLLVYLAV